MGSSLLYGDFGLNVCLSCGESHNGSVHIILGSFVQQPRLGTHVDARKRGDGTKGTGVVPRGRYANFYMSIKYRLIVLNIAQGTYGVTALLSLLSAVAGTEC